MSYIPSSLVGQLLRQKQISDRTDRLRVDTFVDKFVELLVTTTARNQSLVSDKIKQSKTSSKSNVLEARRILGQDSTAYLQSAVMLLWCGDQKDCDAVAMYPSSLPPRVEDYIVWDTVLKDELARRTREYDVLTGQVKTLLPLLAYFLNCEHIFKLSGVENVAVRFDNADNTVYDLERLVDDNNYSAVEQYAQFLGKTLVKYGQVRVAVNFMLMDVIASRSVNDELDEANKAAASYIVSSPEILRMVDRKPLSELASECVDVALFAPMSLLVQNPTENLAYLTVSKQTASQFFKSSMQHTTTFDDSPSPNITDEQQFYQSMHYDDDGPPLSTKVVSEQLLSVVGNSSETTEWMPIQRANADKSVAETVEAVAQPKFERSQHDASQVACYTSVLRQLVRNINTNFNKEALFKIEEAPFKMEFVLASILLLKNASRTVQMDKAFTNIKSSYRLAKDEDGNPETHFYDINENGVFALSDEVQRSIVSIPRLAEGFDIDCIDRMRYNLTSAMKQLFDLVRRTTECAQEVKYYKSAIESSNGKATQELKAINTKRFPETSSDELFLESKDESDESYKPVADKFLIPPDDAASTAFSPHGGHMQSNENLSRRSAVWSDVLRELAISGDRLYSFLQTLAGIVHEDVQAIIKLEDPIVEGNQKALQAQRMEMQKQALAFQRSVLDALLNSVFRSSKIRIDVDRDPQSAANDLAGQIVVVSEESLERVKDLASGSSGVSFFEAQTQLHSYLSKQQGQPMQLKDLVSQVRQIIDDVMGKNSDQSFMIDITTQRAAMQYLAEPKNSMVVRLRPETYAAIRRAYDMLVTEFKSLQRNYRIHRYKSPPRAWECIEGPNRELTDQFAELSGHVLAHSRLFSGSASVYVGIVPAQINMAALKLSLRKTINRALECA